MLTTSPAAMHSSMDKTASALIPVSCFTHSANFSACSICAALQYIFCTPGKTECMASTVALCTGPVPMSAAVLASLFPKYLRNTPGMHPVLMELIMLPDIYEIGSQLSGSFKVIISTDLGSPLCPGFSTFDPYHFSPHT